MISEQREELVQCKQTLGLGLPCLAPIAAPAQNRAGGDTCETRVFTQLLSQLKEGMNGVLHVALCAATQNIKLNVCWTQSLSVPAGHSSRGLQREQL